MNTPSCPMIAPATAPLVLDTNIVLDLLLFRDPLALQFQASLSRSTWQWIATTAMRDELEHVLDYRHLRPRMDFHQIGAAEILQSFDARVRLVAIAPPTPILCRDSDDQKFIDLAVAHKATLLSKDKAVLKLRNRLARLDVLVQAGFPPVADTVFRPEGVPV